MSVVLAFIGCVLLATFPTWHEERDQRTSSLIDAKEFPSRALPQVTLAQAFVASILLLVASLWQHVGSVDAAAIAETTNYGSI